MRRSRWQIPRGLRGAPRAYRLGAFDGASHFRRGLSGKLSAACLVISIVGGRAWTAEAPPAFAGEFKEALGELVLLHEGRKKPLDTYARVVLLQLSGRQRFQGADALDWLLRVLLTPESTGDDQVFLIRHPEVVQALELSGPDQKRYSYAQLEPVTAKLRQLAGRAFELEDKDRSPVERELIRLYINVDTYDDLTATFRFAAPHPAFQIADSALAVTLGLETWPVNLNFLDIYSNMPVLMAMDGMGGGEPPDSQSAVNKNARALFDALSEWNGFFKNMPLAILPVSSPPNEKWLSIWDALGTVDTYKSFSEPIHTLQSAVFSAIQGDHAQATAHVRAYNTWVRGATIGFNDYGAMRAELSYNGLKPVFWAKLILIVAFLASLSAAVKFRRILYPASWILALLGLVLLTVGIVLRMRITGRPPVTNLFETFLFVGWVGMVLGIALEWFYKNLLGLMLATIAGVAMIFVSDKHALEGDTMGMLVAVLDSNFWLSTHVTTITMGYAGCIASGIAGHFYLVQRALRASETRLRESYRALYSAMAFGLIFSFIGTVLGGIWADQSWGRFWGWDPKENGALLIVLWCSLLMHARIGGMIKETGMAAGSVLGVLIVLFAWFGVNLLGVGLHSYGFSSGAFRNLIVFGGAECLFLFVTLGWIRIPRKKRPAAS